MELATELIKALVVDVLILLYKEGFQWVVCNDEDIVELITEPPELLEVVICHLTVKSI